jgi:nucleoside-diphosphate-sugar epimerase
MDDGRPAVLLEETLAAWRWSRGYVENVADAIVLAVTDERAAGRVYNVAEPEALTYADWVREVGRAAGWDGEVIPVPAELWPFKRHEDFRQHFVSDTSCIREELGYREAVPRDEALRRAVEWERAHPPAEVNEALFNYEAEDALLRALREGRSA